MKAVQLAENDQSSIRSKLTQVHYQLSQSMSEDKEEWMRLIDWLSNQNFSFLDSIIFDIPNGAAQFQVDWVFVTHHLKLMI